MQCLVSNSILEELGNEKKIMFIQKPFTIMLSGPSCCGNYLLFNYFHELNKFKKKTNLLCIFSLGKTTFAIKLIQYIQPFQNLLWFNGEENGLPKDIQKLAKNVKISREIPETFENITNDTLIVLDDLMTSAYTKNVCELFTKGSHHKNISVILITQNVFHQGKFCRDISLNCKYLVLFKNPRDKSQIFPLARQVFPECPSSLVKVYKEVTSKPYGYLFMDLTQTTHDIVRFQTDIFNKTYMTCYSPTSLVLNGCKKNKTIEGSQIYTLCVKKL